MTHVTRTPPYGCTANVVFKSEGKNTEVNFHFTKLLLVPIICETVEKEWLVFMCMIMPTSGVQ